MSSSFDSYLRSLEQGEVAERDLSFRISDEEARAKLASFQLPSPDLWVLKIVQAAVLSGADFLMVSQGRTSTAFEWTPGCRFGEDFDRKFLSPGSTVSAPMEALRGGLWPVALHQKRPFVLRLPGERGYQWDGESLSTEFTETGRRVHLEVAHFSSREGLRKLTDLARAARTNATVLRTLTGSAYTAPLVLSVDGLRLDGFERSPTHGCDDSTYPLSSHWLKIPGTPLVCPPKGPELEPRDFPRVWSLVRSFYVDPHRRTPGLVVAVASIRKSKLVPGRPWFLHPRASQLVWVRHGVVIESERLDIEKNALSLAVYVSCDDLGVDLSGLALKRASRKKRRAEVYRDLERAVGVDSWALVAGGDDISEMVGWTIALGPLGALYGFGFFGLAGLGLVGTWLGYLGARYVGDPARLNEPLKASAAALKRDLARLERKHS